MNHPPAQFTIAYFCVFVAVLLPIACAALAKFARRTGEARPRYDNRDPRGWLSRQTDWRARAGAAQANSFEALPFFIAAVLVAHQLGAQQAWVDLLAVAFIALRVAYIALYVMGQHALRSVVWLLAFVANGWIFFLGWR